MKHKNKNLNIMQTHSISDSSPLGPVLTESVYNDSGQPKAGNPTKGSSPICHLCVLNNNNEKDLVPMEAIFGPKEEEDYSFLPDMPFPIDDTDEKRPPVFGSVSLQEKINKLTQIA
jgi:hypothetical protein